MITLKKNHLFSAYGLQPTFSYRSSATPPIQACGALQVYSGNQVCMNDWWCSASLPFICKKCKFLFEFVVQSKFYLVILCF